MKLDQDLSKANLLSIGRGPKNGLVSGLVSGVAVLVTHSSLSESLCVSNCG